MKLNQSVLRELSGWCQAVHRFTEKHAADGLLFAQNVIEDISRRGVAPAGTGGPLGERPLLLLAMDTAFCLWSDDCYDARPEQRASLEVDPFAGAERGEPATPEVEGFLRFESRFRQEADDEAAYRLWLDTAVEMLRAYHRNVYASRSGGQWSYAEHMQNGESSIAVMHIVSTISLIYRLDMPARMSDARFRRMMANLCRTMRLQNDLASVERERTEGGQSNAVLLLERVMPPDLAWSFVLAEREGHERLLRSDLEALPAADPFAGISRTMIAITERFYAINRDRYS